MVQWIPSEIWEYLLNSFGGIRDRDHLRATCRYLYMVVQSSADHVREYLEGLSRSRFSTTCSYTGIALVAALADRREELEEMQPMDALRCIPRITPSIHLDLNPTHYTVEEVVLSYCSTRQKWMIRCQYPKHIRRRLLRMRRHRRTATLFDYERMEHVGSVLLSLGFRERNRRKGRHANLTC